MMERQTNRRIKCVRKDNGTEYRNRRFVEECQRNGKVHHTTTLFSPQQNGLAEEMNRKLMESARAMMEHKNVENERWAEAMNTIAYIKNSVPNSIRPYTTPMKICFKAKPDLSHLDLLKSTGFAHIVKSNRSKLDAKVYPCLFLGFAEDSKAYRVFNSMTKRVEITRSIQLME
uniref:Putative polyprotein n=1 Tax=Albugo laibachii Nc14 TaxID=890382 RepID=F0W9E0_9STRA|nr:putative polyprotein [Albugo laibachii Nc14]CCA27781.1 putative polyprotein [Albugo laibachii Nc14]|eukprot:CCA27781.1 putative polyprotein [Albugo laibachii Nc14]